ncbi:MAG: release factor glutamine methyltransferase [Pseudonocardiales bacterium]|nr:release factor glutamine methyltransferase [Pseudonocardiales bacterium]
MNLGDLLRTGTAQLTAAAIESPRVDAELLLATVAGVQRSRLSLHVEDTIGPESAAEYQAMLERRAAREPLQHIVGEAPFRHVIVSVGPGVFVPRPETELLVDAVLPALAGIAHPVVVDLCSGSGALALALDDEVPGATVIAVEHDPVALGWLWNNTLESAVHVQDGDVTDPGMVRERAAVDAVVSNPPYVPDGTVVSAEVRADPPIAVFAGPDGLAVIPHVIARAAELLRPGGVLALEHDDTHGESVPTLLAADGRWRDIADHADLTGRPRYVVAVRV